MTCKIPTQVLTGDRMSIPLTLTNNGDEAITGKYEANAPKAFLPQNTLGSNATTQAVTLAAHESKTFYLTYLVADTLGNCALDVYFYNHDGSDDHVAETVREGDQFVLA